MSRLHALQSSATWSVLLSLLLLASCSRPVGIHSDDVAAADQHPAPFHDDGATAGNSPSSVSSSVAVPPPEAGLPFHDGQSLPVGTLLTVRLKNPVSADNGSPNRTFEAVVDQPVVIEGNALVPRGAGVAGRIESARISNVKRNRGYVRLTLDSIDVGGRDLPVQTSSLFARGSAPEGAASIRALTLEKGRRLTFRLAEPVYVAGAPTHTR